MLYTNSHNHITYIDHDIIQMTIADTKKIGNYGITSKTLHIVIHNCLVNSQVVEVRTIWLFGTSRNSARLEESTN